MKKITAKARYGLSALFYLAQCGTGSYRQIRAIACHATVPRHYLEQILLVLRRHKFVAVRRGPKGGYALAVAPDEITVGMILEALEGRMNLAGERPGNETLLRFWRTTENEIHKALAVSLGELVRCEEKRNEQIHYCI